MTKIICLVLDSSETLAQKRIENEEISKFRFFDKKTCGFYSHFEIMDFSWILRVLVYFFGLKTPKISILRESSITNVLA